MPRFSVFDLSRMHTISGQWGNKINVLHVWLKVEWSFHLTFRRRDMPEWLQYFKVLVRNSNAGIPSFKKQWDFSELSVAYSSATLESYFTLCKNLFQKVTCNWCINTLRRSALSNGTTHMWHWLKKSSRCNHTTKEDVAKKTSNQPDLDKHDGTLHSHFVQVPSEAITAIKWSVLCWAQLQVDSAQGSS